ncbi:hypothetical protein B0T17DRAFT_534296 [Bombardia bombarda]|uniref:Uncharacterized protein n=1 Tax=Bombardia bombarda TaxID=252184 RepID=A0AA39WUE1_9PEZI|nr:hypothetical protein B0T17DRAFT_534296 [Bombardia bombarda]
MLYAILNIMEWSAGVAHLGVMVLFRGLAWRGVLLCYISLVWCGAGRSGICVGRASYCSLTHFPIACPSPWREVRGMETESILRPAGGDGPVVALFYYTYLLIINFGGLPVSLADYYTYRRDRHKALSGLGAWTDDGRVMRQLFISQSICWMEWAEGGEPVVARNCIYMCISGHNQLRIV